VPRGEEGQGESMASDLHIESSQLPLVYPSGRPIAKVNGVPGLPSVLPVREIPTVPTG